MVYGPSPEPARAISDFEPKLNFTTHVIVRPSTRQSAPGRTGTFARLASAAFLKHNKRNLYFYHQLQLNSRHLYDFQHGWLCRRNQENTPSHPLPMHILARGDFDYPYEPREPIQGAVRAGFGVAEI